MFLQNSIKGFSIVLASSNVSIPFMKTLTRNKNLFEKQRGFYRKLEGVLFKFFSTLFAKYIRQCINEKLENQTTFRT